MLSNTLRTSAAGYLAGQLVVGLRQELDLTPKPGLVDRNDCGSHPDLDHALMHRSVDLLDGYYRDYVQALSTGADTAALRQLGRNAEQQISDQFNTNTHRGALFLGSLLLTGVYRADCIDIDTVSQPVGQFALELFPDRLPDDTSGAHTRHRYQVSGIIDEALQGLPSVFRIGLPSLHQAHTFGWSQQTSLYFVMARLMQTVEDTTTLRRGGRDGLNRLRKDGRALEMLLMNGDDPQPFLTRTNTDYCQQRLTLGGVADLMAMTLGWCRFGEHWFLLPDEQISAGITAAG